MTGRRTLGFAAALAGALLSGAGCSSDSGAGDAPAPAGPYCEAEPAGSTLNSEAGCDLRCPGDASCAPGSDPTFYAAAAVVDITPVVDHVVVFAPGNEGHNYFSPLSGDKCVEKASCDLSNPAGCAAADPNKCTWIAGFGSARPAQGVADPSTVRCLLMKQNNTKIGLCAVDAVGWFYNETERTRDLIEQKYPELELDFFVAGATHSHETQDTLGIWGPSDSTSGVKKEYNARIREACAQALSEANQKLLPVHLEFGQSLVDGHIAGTDPGGHKTAAFVSDTRDPVVIDNQLRTIRFVSAEDDSTVATLINFTSHPEFAGDDNLMTSSDYLHTLREGVEKGLTVKDASGNVLHEHPGVGGVAIFFNGALGGQVGPGEVNHTDFEGNAVPAGLERAYNNGRLLSVYAHEALTQNVERVETAPLGVRARVLYLDVLNVGYHIAIAQGLFDREGYFYDPTRELSDLNFPAIRTQIFVVDVGPAELLGMPGEIHAELLLATRDGKSALDDPYPFTPAPYEILNDPVSNPSCGTDGYSRCDDGPPDIAAMDRSKIIDKARDPAAKYRWVLGLTPDEIGYIVPDYDYKLDPSSPYFDEAKPGNHYEETNSVGVGVQQLTVDPILQLLRTPSVVTRQSSQ